MLKIPSQITKVETTSDKGMKLVVHTNEISPEIKAELMSLHEKFGWLVFSPTENITNEDIPDDPIEFEGEKTPSQSLRDTLFVYHSKQGGKSEDFPLYWKRYCEQKKNEIKRKIDDLSN